MDTVTHTHQPCDPSTTIPYQVFADYLRAFLAGLNANPRAKRFPVYTRQEFCLDLQCGIVAQGFLRPDCDTCNHANVSPCVSTPYHLKRRQHTVDFFHI
jgi:hypothetical protein